MQRYGFFGNFATFAPMEYQKTLDFLYGCLPQFQRIGAAAYKAGLDTTIALDDALGNPHRRYRTVHIAGTNGKGSTSQMIYEGLRAEGHCVGLYTSPHLVDFRERIVVDGEMISEGAVVGFVRDNMELINRLKPSFFELTVAMALWWFAECGVDWAVVEVGMGGRLDSTNIVVPELSVVTNISLDHTQFLGDTIVAIAGEKAGIIKQGVTVVVGESSMEYDDVFGGVAQGCGSRLVFADRESPQPYIPAMGGGYQRKNAQTAYIAMRELGLKEKSIRHAIQGARVKGRWQLLGQEPMVVCDTAHNQAGIKEVTEQLKQTVNPHSKLYFVIGVVGDKDLIKILPLLPTDAYYLVTAPSIPRALPAVELHSAMQEAGLDCELIEKGVASAVARAKELATPTDTIYIGGSTFTVADLLAQYP